MTYARKLPIPTAKCLGMVLSGSTKTSWNLTDNGRKASLPKLEFLQLHDERMGPQWSFLKVNIVLATLFSI